MQAFRPVLLVIGILLTVVGLTMIVPAAVDYYHGDSNWQTFAISAAFTLFIGGGLWITHSGGQGTLSLKQAFLLTTLSWLVTVIFAAIPFSISGLPLSVADAFFEAMSGLTTTGSTVIVGLDEAPPGLLIWRALLQWLGGIGIIVMAIAILPMLQVGGMQLFHLESSDTSEKILPRVTQIVASIAGLYVGISALCAVCYATAGMSAFDAVAHAMTTVATGGFSTRDASMAHFSTPAIDTIAIIFMIAGSLPFTLYLLLVRGNIAPLLRDPQVRLFASIVFILVTIMVIYQLSEGLNTPGDALRKAAFNIVSIITGTGYATTNYSAWGSFAIMVFFFTMFIGGCAGSTSCGIKIFRVHVIYEALVTQLKQIMIPHGVFVPRYGGRPISPEVIASVISFLFFFGLIFAAVSLALSLMGLDTLTAVSASATALANVGPGLGDEIGPTGSFANLPDLAKWVLAAAMLLGRLELFTVLVLFSRTFWR